jgi:tRNA pseudouridine32 synthase/23S rRNA pseudouridine746 synthase
LNNPFYYTPDALCRQAMDELVEYLSGSPSQQFSSHPVSPEFRAEIAKGKMFGVLVVEHIAPASDSSLFPLHSSLSPLHSSLFPLHSSLSYLAGYSGQICGRSDWEAFVPAVFDYLQPDGYFKREEAEIVRINREIESLPRPLRWEGSSDAGEKPVFQKGKRDGESDEEYICRRQFENAEVHRWKLKVRVEREAFEARERQKADKIAALKALRRQKSDALQTWLFRHFVMKNARGEERDLISIFRAGDNLPSKPFPRRNYRLDDGGACSCGEGSADPSSDNLEMSAGSWGAAPPSGSGECCEPKLLQYAFAHGLRPVSMAMFWWGESPKEEVRHHLQHYPACSGKCKPILRWMLQGLDVEPNPLEREGSYKLKIVYEDSCLCVVNKPAGMLSVPGKSRRESVQGVMREHCPDATGPLVVHRLDMATSGLMVIAKTMEAYKDLQRQFATREVRKRYVAVLSREPRQKEGEIALPLRPDLTDRPRQVVDFEHGKPCVTRYEVISGCRVALYPHTGRTHQLRVHCAHRDGLNNPIRGDELYGQRADRLYLHAEQLAFRHPATGETMEFEAQAPF